MGIIRTYYNKMLNDLVQFPTRHKENHAQLVGSTMPAYCVPLMTTQVDNLDLDETPIPFNYFDQMAYLNDDFDFDLTTGRMKVLTPCVIRFQFSLRFATAGAEALNAVIHRTNPSPFVWAGEIQALGNNKPQTLNVTGIHDAPDPEEEFWIEINNSDGSRSYDLYSGAWVIEYKPIRDNPVTPNPGHARTAYF